VKGKSGRGGVSLADFERTLREATASLTGRGLGSGTARITDLRRALGGRVDRDEFDSGLLRLREDGIVALRPHAYPTFLDPSETRDALQEGPSLLFFLHWLK